MTDLSGDLDPEMPRHSVISTDSGIERDLPEAESAAPTCGRLTRRGGMKVKPSVTDSVALMQDVLGETDTYVWGSAGGGSGTLQRRAGTSASATAFPKQQRTFTACIVLMGDDRVLGRMARAYYWFR